MRATILCNRITVLKVLILRDKRIGLIDFGQAKVLSDDLRKKLCMFYMAVTSKNDLFIAKTMLDLGIEVDPNVDMSEEELIRMMPTYANGLLDTAPLPKGVEINPFSEASPLKQLPIKKFNSELFMILRTMGLLRALTETLAVDQPDCYMSTIFRPYAMQGLRRKIPTESEQRRKALAVRTSLTSNISSPFDAALNDTSSESLWDRCAVT